MLVCGEFLDSRRDSEPRLDDSLESCNIMTNAQEENTAFQNNLHTEYARKREREKKNERERLVFQFFFSFRTGMLYTLKMFTAVDVSILSPTAMITRYQDRFHSSPGLTTLRANAEFVSPFWPIARAKYWPTSLAVHVLMPNSKDVLPSELKWYLLLVSGIALPSFNQVTEKFVTLLVTIWLLPNGNVGRKKW